MTTPKRPGGLTALAVLNFVFTGLGLISLLALVAVLKFADQAMAGASEKDRATIAAFSEMGMGTWALLVGSSLLTCALLLIAGIGYLKMKRWGWIAGNLYALLSIVAALLSAFLMPPALGGGINLMTIVGLIYPVLTGILLNTTFKNEFIETPDRAPGAR
ncbi:MAG TPA: hypothetical protein VIU61_03380 [Kofleriaceae bacterium]